MFRPVPLIMLLLLVLLPACGKKGPVRPLEKPLPAAVGALAAAQKGERLLVAWNLPTLNQDGSPLVDLQGFRVYKMRYDLAEDCPECRDTSLLLLSIDLDFPREVSRQGDRFYLWDAELTPGAGYQYRVVPFTRKGREGAPAQVRLPFFTPPAAPAGLTAEGRDRLANLSWQPVALAEGELLGYNVYRRAQEEPFPPRPLNDAPLQDTFYADLGLENGRSYVYAVSAVVRFPGGTTESSLSPTAEATPAAGR